MLCILFSFRPPYQELSKKVRKPISKKIKGLEATFMNTYIHCSIVFYIVF